MFSEERVFDEPNWGTFDANDDIDSVWGFNASSKEVCQFLKDTHLFEFLLLYSLVSTIVGGLITAFLLLYCNLIDILL